MEERLTAHTEVPAAMIAAVFQFTNALGQNDLIGPNYEHHQLHFVSCVRQTEIELAISATDWTRAPEYYSECGDHEQSHRMRSCE